MESKFIEFLSNLIFGNSCQDAIKRAKEKEARAEKSAQGHTDGMNGIERRTGDSDYDQANRHGLFLRKNRGW